jgi:hypothetical protein
VTFKPDSSRGGLRSRTREGNQGSDPGARKRDAIVNVARAAGLIWLLGIAMKARR